MKPPLKNSALQLLQINSSGRRGGSATRELSNALIEQLASRHGPVAVTDRDLANGLPFVSEDWIAANAIAHEDRTSVQRDVLALSDALVSELKASDVVVIGAPIYNFGVPATLKAWFDMVARARVTFRYTDDGPRGLLTGKKAYVVIASGGVPVDSPMDFATPWLRQVLAFIGITDIEVIDASRINTRGAAALEDAHKQIAAVIGDSPKRAA